MTQVGVVAPRRWGQSWVDGNSARRGELKGVKAFCTGDFADHDAYLNLADMAKETEEAWVGTAIAHAFSRTPYAHATAARQLHAMAPGRVFLGFGSGAHRMNRDWFGVDASRPVKRLEEFIQVVRKFLSAENGERITFSGDFYDIDAQIAAPVLGKLDIPLLMAGFNTGMAKAAGRTADGIVGHGLFTERWWSEVVRPAVDAGREHAGRPASAPWKEVGWVITAVDDSDPERARAEARRMVAFYLTVRTYDPFVEHHGWQEQTERLRHAFKAGDVSAMEHAVDDDMLDEIAVAGTTHQVCTLLQSRDVGLPRDLAFMAAPSYRISPRRRAHYAESSLSVIHELTER